MNNLTSNFRGGMEQAWANVLLFTPKILLFAAILVIGYFVARLVCKALKLLLERVRFDRLVERGGIKRVLAKTNWDASDILAKTASYFVLLFALQLAFGVFGPNPISTLLTGIIAYLPNIFVAGLIIVIAAAIAAGARQLVLATFGGLSYGRFLATGAAAALWTVGIFAALDQLQIAPAIVNGLFYAMLAVIVGSTIVAVGGGGIEPMRGVWLKALDRVRSEGPKMAAEAQAANPQVQATVEQWKEEAAHQAEAAQEHHEHKEHDPRPRW